MIEQWELAHFPFEKDPIRYKARVRGSEEDLKDLITKLPVECGKPFVTLSQEFDWAFYLYKLDDAARLKALELFKSFSPNGTVVESPTLHMESELPPMLEDVLEATAKNLIKAGEAKVKQEPSPQPSGSGIPIHNPESPSSKKSEAIATEVKESIFTPLNASYVFPSFIAGPSSRFTHAAAQAVAENPGKIYNPFFIYGGVGLGKTHLMQAIGQFVVSKNPEAQAAFISTEKFMSLVIEGIRKGNINQIRDQFRYLDVLLIDDIQFLGGSESTQEEFFHVFNSLHQMGKQIVITSDRAPKQLATLEDRLRSRFEWGLITDLKPPNLETRAAILKSKADQIDLRLTTEQIMYVADKFRSNVRELEGFVKKIFATSSLMKVKVDLALIKSLIEDDGSKIDVSLIETPLEEKKPAKYFEAKKTAPEESQEETNKESPKKVEELEGIMNRLNRVIATPPQPPTPEIEISPSPSVEPQEAALSPPPPAPELIPEGVVSPLLPEPPVPEAIPPSPPPVELSPPEPQVEAEALPSAPVMAEQLVDPVAVPEPVVEKLEEPETVVSEIPPQLEETGSFQAPIPSPPEEPKASPSPDLAVEEEKPDPDDPEIDKTLRAVEVVCFYPREEKAEYANLRTKFNMILKKHKLKFRVSRLAERSYDYNDKNVYEFFSKICREAKCSIALVLGPPPSPWLSEDDFAGVLSSLLEEERISLQFIPWSEMGKDYRYLNSALDLSLLLPVK